jgi:hypothetical protein
MRSSKVNAGDTGTISQYNNLRDDAKASSWLLPREQTSPNLTLYIESGSMYFGPTLVEYAGGNSPSFTAPATNPRIDVLSIDNTGTLIRTAGTENVSPVAPAVPSDNIPICQVYNRVGQTTIRDVDTAGQGYILKDTRKFLLTPKKPTKQIFTSSGTWTKPAGLQYVVVEVQGGGGGGSGAFTGSAGGAGGSSSFGSHCSATGGAGGVRGNDYSLGGAGSSGDVNTEGQYGYHAYDGSGPGGAAYFGRSGGRGGSVTSNNSSDNGSTGGAGGGYSRKIILESSLGATETVTVGTGGTAGTGNSDGDAGLAGIVVVTEFY